jgi:hypothetical protein
MRADCVSCGFAVQVTLFWQQLLVKRRAANTAERVGRRVLAELMPDPPLQGLPHGSVQHQSACTLGSLLEDANLKVRAAGRQNVCNSDAMVVFCSVQQARF